VKRRSTTPRWCRIDVHDPHGKAAGESLRVVVEPDRTDHRPADTVAVRLRVTDPEGRPAAKRRCRWPRPTRACSAWQPTGPGG